MSSAAVALPEKSRVVDALRKHFFLRVHMFVIVGGTISVGLLSTKILLITHERNLAVRYGIAVVVAFAAFLGFIKLWLRYVAHCAARSGDSDWSDVLDFDCDGIDVGGSGSSSDFSAGGGRFGGGGASGSWTDEPVVAVPMKSGSESPGFTFGGSSIDVDDDLGIVILVALLIVVIAFAALWVIWAAPAILSEAAFQATLAATLARRAKKISNGSWVGSIFRATAIPFALILIAAVGLGWFAQKRCPSATRIRDAIHCVVVR